MVKEVKKEVTGVKTFTTITIFKCKGYNIYIYTLWYIYLHIKTEKRIQLFFKNAYFVIIFVKTITLGL